MTRAAISGIEVFLAIVREGSLRAAARSLGVGAPAVSHQLKALERRIGVELLVRTTRSIELTEAGRTLLAGTAPAFREIVDAIEGSRVIGRSTTGTLRLTLPRSAYKMIIAPVLADFQAQYPGVCLDLSINEGLVDIVREGFHAGFRLGDRLTSDMVAVRLTGPLTPCYSAAPSYLAAFGRPKHPRDLLNHKCVRYKFVTAKRIWDWQFVEDGQVKTVDPPARLVFDSMQSVMQAVRDGHGIGWSLRTVIEDHLRAGALETVLDPYVTELPPFYLYYPEQNRRLELLRVFIDFLASKRESQAAPLL
ncbi:MAG TPA: LysR family transcriptional regulator [Candidatus Angelobacter sp.]|nr:LysR family transcriptional regulator [Candidatus Angelobacter sp.]